MKRLPCDDTQLIERQHSKGPPLRTRLTFDAMRDDCSFTQRTKRRSLMPHPANLWVSGPAGWGSRRLFAREKPRVILANMNAEVTMTLSGRLSYEQELTIVQATQVIALVNDTDPEDYSSPVPEASTRPPAAGASISDTPAHNPREALESSGAKTATEKIVAFACYLLRSEGHDTFRSDTLREVFQRAREPIPTHFARELSKAIQAGWIGESPTRGEYYVLAAADNVIDEGFNAIRPKRTRSKREGPRPNSRGRSRATVTPAVFADMEIPTVIEGLPSYHQIRMKRDKVLWALKLSRNLGIPGLQNGEIAWLTDALGEGILVRDINSHYRGLQRQGYANRSTSDHALRITERGETYLKSLSPQAGR
jgi:hypothetical protein